MYAVQAAASSTSSVSGGTVLVIVVVIIVSLLIGVAVRAARGGKSGRGYSGGYAPTYLSSDNGGGLFHSNGSGDSPDLSRELRSIDHDDPVRAEISSDDSGRADISSDSDSGDSGGDSGGGD